MFDVGFAEILLLLVIGLLVLGPERLPKVARTLGAYLSKARNAWNQVKYDIDREIQATEFKETWQKSMMEAGRSLDSIRDEINIDGDSAKAAADAKAADPGKPKEPDDAPDETNKAPPENPS